MNINAIREASGAHIEVEKQKGQGDRTVIIRGSAESTRIAQQLINALIKEPDKELTEILLRYNLGLGRMNNFSASFPETFRSASIAVNNPSLSNTAQVSTVSSQKSLSRQQLGTKTSGNPTFVTKTTSIPPPSLPANATPPFTNQIRSVVSNSQNIRPGIPVCTTATPPFLNNAQNAWTGVVVTGKVPANMPRPSAPICTSSTALNANVSARVVASASVEKCPTSRQLFSQEKSNAMQSGSTTNTKTTVSYTMAVIAQGKSPKTVPANVVSVATKVTATSDTKVSTISPISIERAGSAPPSGVIHSQMTLGHSSCSGPSSVQPFATNQSPKISNNSLTEQGATVQARIHVTQAPVQSKPFINAVVPSSQTSASLNPQSTSPTSSHAVVPGQSTIAQEYSPFNNNRLAKVTQSVWGQKEKETSKPNFASVAASGVTSVSSQVQNSNPVQSTLTLSLPQNSEPDLVIDAAKAPGYRGNLHISPSASSNTSASSNPSQVGISHNSNFGPIGSGPRSAPCTPPLGPIGPPSSASSSTRRSTPPAASSPPPQQPHLSRSLPDSQGVPLNELPRSLTVGCSGIPTQHMSSQMSEAIFHHQGLGMSSHLNRLQSYPMATTLASPGGTNTTFSQHSPLSSVGAILPEGASNGTMQVVQSNLNPNAPDFSSRASLLMAQHGPPMHHLPRLPSGPNTFQENAVPHLAQFRPILASGGGINHGFPLHAVPSNQAQAAINRFSFHHVPNHQQQATDYSPNGTPGAVGTVVGGMSQGTDGMPLLSMVSNYHSVVPGGGNIPHHYPGLQSMMGIRPNQRSTSTTPSVGTSSKDEGSPMAAMSPSASPQGSNLPSPTGMNIQENPNPAGTIGEDRKLPRPIGMERAQRKNPMFGGVSDVGGIWSLSSSGRCEIPVTGEWIHNMQGTIPAMQQEDSGIPPSMHNYTGNRYADMMAMENNHPLDQSFQAVASGGYPFMNGLPPHMLAPHIYQNNAAVGPGPVDAQIEMWGVHPKVPLSSSGDGLPQNVEHKMSWQNWSPHQA